MRDIDIPESNMPSAKKETDEPYIAFRIRIVEYRVNGVKIL